MKENKRRSLTLIIITIATLVLVVSMATYAFFATTRDVNNAINASVGTAASMYSFSASSNGNIEMNIAFNEMSEANVSTNVLKTDNATIDVFLASPTNDMKTVCTYDIIWVWDSEDKYTEPDVELPYIHTDNKIYNYEFSAEVDNNSEKDLSKYPTSGNTITLQTGASIESNSTIPTTKTYNITSSIYNLPVDQKKLFGKSFKAHITIDNLDCTMEEGNSGQSKNLAKYIMEDVYTGSNPSGEAGLYYHDGRDENDANDGTYRFAGSTFKCSEDYYDCQGLIAYTGYEADECDGMCYILYYEWNYGAEGASYNDENALTAHNDIEPEVYSHAGAIKKAIEDGYMIEEVNNYVCFAGDDCDNENNLYRIISVDSKTNQVKLIKATIAGIMPWDLKEDDLDSNIWEGSIIEKYLNSNEEQYYYYCFDENDNFDTCQKEGYLHSLGKKVNLIASTKWKVGGRSLDKYTTKDFKEAEAADSIMYTGKVGLIYPSDWGYATVDTYWSEDINDSGIEGVRYNWLSIYDAFKVDNLNPGYDWINGQPLQWQYTISAYAYSSYEVFADWFNTTISLINTLPSTNDFGFRPAFNLKSSVKIKNADAENVGSISVPMIIG